MGNLSGYDATQYDPNATGTFEPVPKGDYTAVMTASQFKPTSKGDGEFLECLWEIVDGEFAGKKVYDRLNLKNSNDTAVKIANNTLSAICHAVGVLHPDDSSELQGKPAMIAVDVEERKDKPGNFSNRITKYSAVGAAPAANTATTAPAGNAAKSGAKPPWKK